MKETELRIRISAKLAEQSRISRRLTSEIRGLPGIIRVEIPFDNNTESADVSVLAQFENASELRSLHKRLMKFITKCDGVCVTGISYDLNAMFGE